MVRGWEASAGTTKGRLAIRPFVVGDKAARARGRKEFAGRARYDAGAKRRLGGFTNLERQSQGGGLCTQAPPTIVATTRTLGNSSGSHAIGSRSRTTKSA